MNFIVNVTELFIFWNRNKQKFIFKIQRDQSSWNWKFWTYWFLFWTFWSIWPLCLL